MDAQVVEKVIRYNNFRQKKRSGIKIKDKVDGFAQTSDPVQHFAKNRDLVQQYPRKGSRDDFDDYKSSRSLVYLVY